MTIFLTALAVMIGLIGVGALANDKTNHGVTCILLSLLLVLCIKFI